MENNVSSYLYMEYHSKLATAKKKVIKVWVYITLGNLFPILAFLLLYNEGNVFQVLLYVFLGLFGMLIMITILLLKYYVSEKPLYQYLYPKMIDSLLLSESIAYSYESYPKESEFLKMGGLFPRFCSKILRVQLSIDTKSGVKVDIYDAYLFTQTNNATVVHFNGFYYVFHLSEFPFFQIRTNGSPHSKETKYKKIHNGSSVNSFVSEGSVELIENKYYQIYDYIVNLNEKSKVYVSGSPSELHVGLWIKKMKRSVKKLSNEAYTELNNSLASHLQIIDYVLNKLLEVR